MDARSGNGPALAVFKAFSTLVERHGPPLFRYLLRMVGNRALAEDLVQDTFATAYAHRGEFREPGSVRAWLFAIARNRALNALRDGQRVAADSASVARELARLPVSAANPEGEVLRLELRAEILAALRQLPPARRDVVVLRDLEGLSYAEIAAITDSTEGAVRVQVHRARRQLQALLAPYLSGEVSVAEAGRDREDTA
jgi:RNA polymerase sigma-70 factor (ECF subfamily)